MYIVRAKDCVFENRHINGDSCIMHHPVKTGTIHFGFNESHYHPGAIVGWGCIPIEHVYYVVKGEVIFRTDEGEYTLTAGDSIYIGIEDNREIRNETDATAVVISVAGEDPNNTFAPPEMFAPHDSPHQPE